MTADAGPGQLRRASDSWIVVAVAGFAAVVAVAVAVLAWLQPLGDLSREDARQFTADALEAAGFTEGGVLPDVEADVYSEPERDSEIAVWVTTTNLNGHPVELWIDREGAQAVLVNDHTPDGPLLTDEQFQILDDYDVHPDLDERRRRNWIVTAVAVVVAAAAAALIVWTLRRRTAEPTDE